MKKIYLLFFMAISSCGIFAQVTITSTAGTTGPTNYPTMQSAFTAINAGTHQGVINISVAGTVTETSSAVLNASGVATASYSSVIIKPSGAVGSVITGNVNGPLIDLNGADNIVINGLNTGSNSLTISNTSISSLNNTSTIRFINDATTDSILNTSILGADTSVTSGTILFSTASAGGNDNNVISGCIIADAGGLTPTNALYSAGAVGQENSNVKLTSNFISNFFNANIATSGITIGTGNTNWSIVSNRFFQTAIRTYTLAAIHRGIQILSGDNYVITDNTIGAGAASGLGVYTMNGAVASRYIGIDLTVGTANTTSVQNNVITRFSLTSTGSTSSGTGVWCGININSGNVNVGTINGNTIGNMTGTGSIIVTPGAGAWITAIVSASTGTVNISNNNVGAIAFQPTGVLSGTINLINLPAATGTYNINNNTLGNTTANNIVIGTVATTSNSGIIRGIFNVNSGTVNITSNTIQNLTHNSSGTGLFRGIEFQQGTGTISGNIVNQITTNGTPAGLATPAGLGIIVTSALSGITVAQNIITNLNLINTTGNSTVVIGIWVATAPGISVTKNILYGFTNASFSSATTSPPIMAGIYHRDGSAAAPTMTFANNMISLGNSQSTNTAIIGIWSGANSTIIPTLTSKIYYNSVNIEGTVAVGAQPSFCYYRGDFSATSFTTPPVIDIKNNIFTNTRSGGIGKHYAISNGYPNAGNASGWGVNASNYNVLNANVATVGFWSADVSYLGWKSASSGDVNSLSGVTVNYVNSASDLHLINNSNSAVDGKATPIAGITTDIDNDLRDASIPDLGADEFSLPIPVIFEYFKGAKQANMNVLNWKAFCTSPSVKFEIERSNDGRHFSNIGSITATQLRTLQAFDFSDNSPLSGTNYYRLKMTESDGGVSYSIVIAIIGKEVGFQIVSLMPTLVDKSFAILNVSTAQSSTMDIVISDISGKTVLKQNATLNAGSNTININMERLAGGIYQLTGYTSNQKIRIIQFVKK